MIGYTNDPNTFLVSNIDGLSGIVEMDKNGLRTNFILDILSLEEEPGLVKIGNHNIDFEFETKLK